MCVSAELFHLLFNYLSFQPFKPKTETIEREKDAEVDTDETSEEEGEKCSIPTSEEVCKQKCNKSL